MTSYNYTFNPIGCEGGRGVINLEKWADVVYGWPPRHNVRRCSRDGGKQFEAAANPPQIVATIAH